MDQVLADFEVEVINLKAALRQAEENLSKRKVTLQNSVSPTYRFWVERSDSFGFDRILDDSCTMYRLNGEVTNREECEAVGRSGRDLDGGGMNFLRNSLSQRVVMWTGGGRVWIGGPYWDHGPDTLAASERAMNELEGFIAENLDGGDVTEIVMRYRKATGKE